MSGQRRARAGMAAFGMPAWAKMLTPAQIWQLTACLNLLRTSQEPQPPL
jgi:hypothetical protein